IAARTCQLRPPPGRRLGTRRDSRDGGGRPGGIVTRSDHPHTALGHSLDAFRAQVEEVTRRISQLELPARDAGELGRSARSLEAATAELREAQEELESEVAALRELLEAERIRYRELFQSAPEAYLVTDANGLVLEVNRAAEQLFGFRRGVLESAPITRLLPVDERR